MQTHYCGILHLHFSAQVQFGPLGLPTFAYLKYYFSD